ncbi:MAG: EVE domain-containing protein [Betaproteobacteria bacterium]|nr:EVE domain-containing protein [Betaproteobacteria bacterium]MDE2622369.1 EVE domain-containing protein [Betaproteobacteria bacterium]
MAYWLMKSEPSEVSIDDLLQSPGQRVDWFGVRNYQARNYMMRDMKVGDGVLFYHSSCPQPGVAGLAEVSRLALPDETQFDSASPYYDPKATRERPRWYNVEVRAVKKTPLLPLAALRAEPALQDMRLLARGNRLSITPVTPAEWKIVLGLLSAESGG